MHNKNYIIFGLVLLISLILMSCFTFLRKNSIIFKDRKRHYCDNYPFKLSDNEISIVNPENKTYTEPMSGYYPAIYGFENDKNGEDPHGIDVSSEATINTEIQVIDGIDEHYKVLEVDDQNNTDGWPGLYLTSMFLVSYGTLEYWLRFDNIDDGLGVDARDSGNKLCINFMINSGRWRYKVGPSAIYDIPNVPIPQKNTWYHFRVDFRCQNAPTYLGISQNSYIVHINGISSGEIPFRNSGNNITRYSIISNPFLTITFWVDAIGYSWDLDYTIGDNINEGILLSFDNNTILDWMGYSLDGLANKTIIGNTTITMPVDGSHTIQIFGNSSLGTMYRSELRYFTIDTTPPEISITYPLSGQEFRDPPSFIVLITEENPTLSWYTLNGGSSIFFMGTSGVINSTAWNNLTDGPITIKFYVLDIADREDFDEVTIIKSTEETIPPEISGYNIFLLLGISSAGICLIIRRNQKY